MTTDNCLASGSSGNIDNVQYTSVSPYLCLLVGVLGTGSVLTMVKRHKPRQLLSNELKESEETRENEMILAMSKPNEGIE
jgi:hypothetical protein